MKTKINVLFLIFLSITAVTLGNTEPKGKYTKEKKIKKEYIVNADARLVIDNSYGHVNIVSWDQNKTIIEVHVKTNGNNEDKVQEKLDDIDVSFEGNDTYVSAKTNFKNRSRSWWNSWRDSNVNMEVNYTVKVPVTNDIDISNDYGPISLNRIEGNAKIRCDYGKMTLGELMAENNYLNFDYTNNSTIAYMKSGRINADYSSFTLEKAGNIELNADYSKSRFGTVGNLNFNSEYGSISTDESGDIVGRGDYLSARFGIVHGDVNLNTDYGSIRIDELATDAGDVAIQSDYTGIKIGYNYDYNFTFNITLEYAGLSGKDDLEVLKQRIESSDRYYEGYYRSASSRNNININSEYGGVTLFKQ